MKIDPNALSMIAALADAYGPSGFEDEVLTQIRRFAPASVTIEEDCLRNLYLYRRENTGHKPVLMLDAHSDEVGFMVHSVKPNGTLRFVTLGGWNVNSLPSGQVLVRNRDWEWLPGIIASKPVHFMSSAERSGEQNFAVSDLIIDVGACSYEEAVEVFRLRMGEPIVPAAEFAFDEKRDVMFGKGFDCRIGCAVLLEALRRLEGEDLPCDVVGVFSSQEEVGDRGVRVSVGRVKPDAAIVLEGCPADDTFTEPYAIQTALKKGPMLRFLDTSVICNPRFQRFALDLAEEQDLAVQTSVREGGGNDGSVIQTCLGGVPVIVAGVPVRYIHSLSCITSYADFEHSVRLVCALLRSLTPEQIRRF